MSDAYRDELNAALAANESLRDELKTLKQSLEQERDHVRRQQEMLRAQGVPIARTPSDNKRFVFLGVAVALGIVCAMCAAGMVLFTASRAVAPEVSPTPAIGLGVPSQGPNQGISAH